MKKRMDGAYQETVESTINNVLVKAAEMEEKENAYRPG
jgi:hypothetical protein